MAFGLGLPVVTTPRPLPVAKTALDLFAWLDTELKAGRLTATQYDILWAYVLAHR